MAVDSNVFKRNVVVWDWYSDPIGRTEYLAGRMADATTGSDGLYTGYAGFHRSAIDIYNADQTQYHLPLIHSYVNEYRNIFFENHTDAAGDTYVRPQGSQIGGYAWFPLCWLRVGTLINKHYGTTTTHPYIHLDPHYTPRNISYSYLRDDINNNIAVQDSADPYGDTGPEKKANMMFDLMRQYNLTAGYKIAVCPLGLGADTLQSSTAAFKHRLYNHPSDAVTGHDGAAKTHTVYHANGITETKAWMDRFVAQWKLRIESGNGTYSYPGTFAFDIENKDDLTTCLAHWDKIVADPRFASLAVAHKRDSSRPTLSQLWAGATGTAQWNVTGSVYPSNATVHGVYDYVTGGNAYSTVANRPWTKWFRNTIRSNDFAVFEAVYSSIKPVLTNTRVGNYAQTIGRSDVKTGLAQNHLWLTQESNEYHNMDMISPPIYGVRTAAMAAQRYDLVNPSILPVTVSGDERGSHASWLQACNYYRNNGATGNWDDMVWEQPAANVVQHNDNGLPQWVYPGLSQTAQGPGASMSTSNDVCTRYWPTSYPDRYYKPVPANTQFMSTSTTWLNQWKGVTGTTSHLAGTSTAAEMIAGVLQGVGDQSGQVATIARDITALERHTEIHAERRIELQKVMAEYWRQENWGVNYTRKLNDMTDKAYVPWIMGPCQSDMIRSAGDFMSPARSQQIDGIGDYGDLYDGVPFGHKEDNTNITGSDSRRLYQVAFEDMLHKRCTNALAFSKNSDGDGFDFMYRLMEGGDVLTKSDDAMSFTPNRKLAGTLSLTLGNTATQGRNWGYRNNGPLKPRDLSSSLSYHGGIAIARQWSAGWISGPNGTQDYVQNPTVVRDGYTYGNCNIYLSGDPIGGSTNPDFCQSCVDKSSDH